jgi:apolipoprotein N-acyltransferase
LEILKKIALAGFAGLLYALSFHNALGFHFFALHFIALGLWISLIIRTNKVSHLIITQIIFNLSITLLCFHWIAYTVSVFGGLDPVTSHLVMIAFSLIACPFLWPGILLIKFLQKKKLFSGTPMGMFTLAACFTLLEFITPNQFPTQAGYLWIQLKSYLGLAPIFGAGVFSLLSYWISFSLYSKLANKQSSLVNNALIILCLILNFAIAPLTIHPPRLIPKDSEQRDQADQTNIRIVQANIGNLLKLSSEDGEISSIKEVYDRYRDLSLRPSDRNLDLIVWPETAYPKTINSDVVRDSVHFTPSMFKNIMNAHSADVVTGGYDIGQLKFSTNDFQTEYNSLFHFKQSGVLDQIYHKHILIPFGETLPFGPLNRFAGKFIKGVSFFSQGHLRPSFTLSNGQGFIPAICYEILRPFFVRSYLANYYNEKQSMPSFIVNLTNDSWYDLSVEQDQHLAMAKWRAIEFQIPIVRSTNTGLTSLLDVDGSESDRLQRQEKNILDFSLNHQLASPTLYMRLGLWGLLALTLLISLCLLFEKRALKK